MIAGTGSGCGKTTVTCAVLAALTARNRRVISYKSGPDFIDPMFHRRATGVNSANLDIFLMGETGVRQTISRNAPDYDIAVIEGVMGLYDGQGDTTYASSNHLSLLTETPTILVVNARGMAASICALISGYIGFAENRISAVILNNVRQSSYQYYRQMITTRLGIPVIGYMPTVVEAAIESRHLGLVTADEITDITEKIIRLRDQALISIDFDALESIAQTAVDINVSDSDQPQKSGFRPDVTNQPIRPRSEYRQSDRPVKIYAAVDEAFCFYYQDNHSLLSDLGAQVEFFSPLHDRYLPDDADGVILWGGYPELYAGLLAENHSMINSLRIAIGKGLPVYAECGGFMYLQEQLTDSDGQTHDMVGVLPGGSKMTDRLQDFGYFTITAQKDNLLCQVGQSINAHFFHHSISDFQGDAFVGMKSGGATIRCIVAKGRLLAGYQHLHFSGNPDFARSLVANCDQYGSRQS
jgi:cobyrinic acid a,c-diamide synthase